MARPEASVLVGLSGWDYPGWQKIFYPDDLKPSERLGFVADQFRTVEVNGSFYSLQRPSTYERWYETTPPGFVFALKGGRFITHMRRLRDTHQALANFFASGPLVLEEKLGPILWQLPASFTFDEHVIAEFLDALPKSTGAAAELARHHDEKVKHGAVTDVSTDRPLEHALEVRDRSFDHERFYALLAESNVACVVSDSPTWPMFEHQTARHSYVRLHGHSALYTSGYSSRNLDEWAQRSARWARRGPVYVYFDNDARVRAPADALALMKRLALE